MNAGAEQRIFISYRRSDCQSQANGLHDGLKHRLAESRIFMDIDSIPPGADFEEHIRGEIEQCHVVLVLIGDEWLDPRPGTDVPRLAEPNDFVRLEIESALAAEHVRVVPLLVEKARMPAAEELPESIRRLARLNAFELSDSRWSSDIERLTQQLRKIATSKPPTLTTESAPTMTFADVDDDAILYAVSALPSKFTTKDLSEHPAVQATHTQVAQLRNYHTIMGRYLMQNRNRLGLGEPGKPVDDRGSVWMKRTMGSTQPRPPQPGSASGGATVLPRDRVAPAASASTLPHTRTPVLGLVMIPVPLLTFGYGAWVPPVWAAFQRRYDRAFRTRMTLIAAALAVTIVVATVLLASAPVNDEGTPTGTGSDVGIALLFLTMIAGFVVAIVYRNPRSGLPGTEALLARRASRERYRRLVHTDRPLAASMLVGRPDIARDYDDGGLLDLNSLSVEALAVHGGISREEATRIVEVRTQLGRFADVKELLAYVDLSESSATQLGEVAIFL